MKICTTCKENLPDSAYYRRERGYLRSECIGCRAKRSAEHYKNNREMHRKAGRRYALRKLYGMTLEEYEQLVIEQEHKCALCQMVCPLVVDHDHATTKRRALLCRACNAGLGHFKDSPQLMRDAAAYVEFHAA